MSDDPYEWPDDGYIYMNWLTTGQAAEIAQMSLSGIATACRDGRLRAKKLGGKFNGVWRIDPDSASGFNKDPRGRPPEDKDGGDNNDDIE